MATPPQNKLVTLKESEDSGAKLDKDQKAAVKRLDEVSIQLEVVRDLQRQFASFSQEVRERGMETRRHL